MKTIIAGSRRIPSLQLNEYRDWYIPSKRQIIYSVLDDFIKESKIEVSAVISGACWGIDQLGEEWAKKNSKEISTAPADWKKYGKRAGFIRNSEMALAGDCLICIYSSGSSGSLHMISEMKRLGKPIFEKVL